MIQNFDLKTQQKIGNYWSQKTAQKKPSYNWWSCPQVIRHLNRRVCGQEVDGVGRGLYEKANTLLNGKKLRLGISVGCGNGLKEMKLIQWGLVEKFICFELSQERIIQGKKEAKKRALSDAIEFRCEDAFLTSDLQPADLVHWNNSLHHMPDTFQAVIWSKKMLKSGGLFLMDDYVGPNYIQFTDRSLELASQVRKGFPQKYLVHPCSSLEKTVLVDTQCQRTDRAKVIAKDPSEAADAENILPAIDRIFPQAEVTRTGGIVYFIALPPLYGNFDRENELDNAFLERCLFLDELYTHLYPNETLYATAIAIKS